MNSFVPERCLTCPVVAEQMEAMEIDLYFADQAVLAGVADETRAAAELLLDEYSESGGYRVSVNDIEKRLRAENGQLFVDLTHNTDEMRAKIEQLVANCRGHLGARAVTTTKDAHCVSPALGDIQAHS